MDTIKINSKKVKMIAHRGASGLERENTCPAFLVACNRSYFGVETDVRMTTDKKFIILHDATTQRVSMEKNNINVEECDYASLENIVLPDHDGSTDRRDIRLPLLKEYIKICKKYEKICVVEIKDNYSEDDIKNLIAEITNFGYIQNVIFISFNLQNCLNARKFAPANKVQWLIGKKEITEENIKMLCDNKLDVDVYYKDLTKDIIKNFHRNKIEVNCWTCDDPDDAKKLIKMGVDYITSNILE